MHVLDEIPYAFIVQMFLALLPWAAICYYESVYALAVLSAINFFYAASLYMKLNHLKDALPDITTHTCAAMSVSLIRIWIALGVEGGIVGGSLTDVENSFVVPLLTLLIITLQWLDTMAHVVCYAWMYRLSASARFSMHERFEEELAEDKHFKDEGHGSHFRSNSYRDKRKVEEYRRNHEQKRGACCFLLPPAPLPVCLNCS